MSEQEKITQEKIVSDKNEILAIMADKAVFVNHAYGVLIDDNIRITWAEKTPDDAVKIPRFTIIISKKSLLEFTGMFNGMCTTLANAQAKPQTSKKPDRENLDGDDSEVLH